MAAKTQQELEQVVKGYQLAAVEAKVDQALNILTRVENQTIGLVTPVQLATAEKNMQDKLVEEVAKIHLTYAPLKKKIDVTNGTILTAVLLQVIYILFNIFGGR